MWCDGACRYNGTSRAVGGWGFQIRPKYGKRKGFYGVVAIPHHLGLTVNDANNRGSLRRSFSIFERPAHIGPWITCGGRAGAELTAIIQALLKAVEQQADLHNPGTRFICMLHSDSKLAVGRSPWFTRRRTPR